MKSHFLFLWVLVGGPLATSSAAGAEPTKQDCAQRLDKATMPTVVPMAKNAAGHDLSAVRVTLDGQPLRDLPDGTAIAIDPGEHTFAFEADGRHKTEETAIVREGSGVGAWGSSSRHWTRLRTVREILHSSASSTWRSFGRALGAAGGVGIAMGAIVGLVAKGAFDHALQAECSGDPRRCAPQGKQDGRTAER